MTENQEGDASAQVAAEMLSHLQLCLQSLQVSGEEGEEDERQKVTKRKRIRKLKQKGMEEDKEMLMYRYIHVR